MDNKPLSIQLDRSSGRPLYRQLYDELKRLIIEGVLPPGHRMPSSRELSKELDISRSTATFAFDQLLADGFFQAYSGTGTFVSRELSNAGLLKPQRPRSTASGTAASSSAHAGSTTTGARSGNPDIPYTLSSYGIYLSKQKEFTQEARLLRGGAVSFDDFPTQVWKGILNRRTRALNSLSMEYPDDAAGYLPLRAAIACYLSDSRGVNCTSAQILITSGSQQALDLIARVHIRPGDNFALEDPGYFLAQRTFGAYGANLVPIPVDSSGLVTQQLDTLDQDIQALYVTPSHQFPLGGTLSLSRRMVLLEWAHRTGTILIEDDYDSEFRFGGRPLSALQGLDEDGSVIYTGSFSKVLFPSLRLGYIVVPPQLMPIYTWAKRLADHFSPALPQMVLADFIEEGHLEKHISKMRGIYGQKRQLLITHLQEKFGDKATIIGENAGLHLTARFHLPDGDAEILKAAETAQLPFRSTVHTYLASTRPPQEFVLSYSNLPDERIVDGIKIFADRLLELSK